MATAAHNNGVTEYTTSNGHKLTFNPLSREYAYRDHVIYVAQQNLIPAMQWCWEHKDFDGPEDNRYGYCPTVEDCMAEIDAVHDDEVEPEMPLLTMAAIALAGCLVLIWFAIHWPEI